MISIKKKSELSSLVIESTIACLQSLTHIKELTVQHLGYLDDPSDFAIQLMQTEEHFNEDLLSKESILTDLTTCISEGYHLNTSKKNMDMMLFILRDLAKKQSISLDDQLIKSIAFLPFSFIIGRSGADFLFNIQKKCGETSLDIEYIRFFNFEFNKNPRIVDDAKLGQYQDLHYLCTYLSGERDIMEEDKLESILHEMEEAEPSPWDGLKDDLFGDDIQLDDDLFGDKDLDLPFSDDDFELNSDFENGDEDDSGSESEKKSKKGFRAFFRKLL